MSGEVAFALYIAIRFWSISKDQILHENIEIIVDGISIPIEQTLRGRSAGRGSKRRPVGAGEKEREVASVEYAAAWVAQRYRVPPVLAATIARLAGLGARQS